MFRLFKRRNPVEEQLRSMTMAAELKALSHVLQEPVQILSHADIAAKRRKTEENEIDNKAMQLS